VVQKTVCEAVSYLYMTTALSLSVAGPTQIWITVVVLVKSWIDMWVFESRSQSLND